MSTERYTLYFWASGKKAGRLVADQDVRTCFDPSMNLEWVTESGTPDVLFRRALADAQNADPFLAVGAEDILNWLARRGYKAPTHTHNDKGNSQ